jgi:outer membrane protein OmpA-like peptidoglycan-associated protein/opacity protein-like surface antigen
MKQTFLLALFCFVITSLHSQDVAKEQYTIAKEQYPVSGGVLGAVNFSEFRKPSSSIDYDTKAGWAVGAWVNFPVTNGFSIEPQPMYSSYRYSTPSSTSVLLKDGSVRYLSVPIVLKFHAGDHFAIIAGPQVDFTANVTNEDGGTAQESDFKQTSFSAFGGFEVLPHGRVTIFGRYVYGFTNMSDITSENGALDYKNQNIQAGLKIKLFGKKPITYKATSTPVILDTDGDGINDDVDKCPNEAGVAKYNGCPVPDSDKDGINDEEDKCPNEAGIAKYNGCPIPDSDKDGINDEEDKCPSEAGPASNNGCPVLDRDGDGVNDDADKCPDVAGPASNNGCPEVQVSAEVNKILGGSGQAVYFSSNNAKLASTSNASLNKIATVLKNNPDVKIKIEGHTDNAEKDVDNLSEQRADAVKRYFVSKGISEDRITVEGSGSTMPIADNGTSAGRTKNRRVEIKIKD